MPDRYATKHPHGWAVKAPGGMRASSVHKTQREAEKTAKRTVGNLGGERSASRAGMANGGTPTRYRPGTIPTRHATGSTRQD